MRGGINLLSFIIQDKPDLICLIGKKYQQLAKTNQFGFDL